MFDGGGSQFVFNLGGGPGFRVHQFGGGRPRRRPREANNNSEERPATAMSALSNLLPLLILFVLPLLSSIFSSTTSSGPSIRFDAPKEPYTMRRVMPQLRLDYYINPADVVDYTGRKMNELDRKAENKYIADLQYECQAEHRHKGRMFEEAQGWFFQDPHKMQAAREYDMRNCRRLEEFGFPAGAF